VWHPPNRHAIRRWTQDHTRDCKHLGLHEQRGLSVPAISRLTGVATSTLYGRFHRLKKERRLFRTLLMAPATRGLTPQKISMESGMPEWQIDWWAKQLGFRFEFDFRFKPPLVSWKLIVLVTLTIATIATASFPIEGRTSWQRIMDHFGNSPQRVYSGLPGAADPSD